MRRPGIMTNLHSPSHDSGVLMILRLRIQRGMWLIVKNSGGPKLYEGGFVRRGNVFSRDRDIREAIRGSPTGIGCLIFNRERTWPRDTPPDIYYIVMNNHRPLVNRSSTHK